MIKLAFTKRYSNAINSLPMILNNDKNSYQLTFNNQLLKINHKGMFKSNINAYLISTNSIAKKLQSYYHLCRWHQPIGAMLLYWPTAWGVCIGSPGVASVYYILLFLMGSWTSRSAGCIVNDYFDRQFDKQVQRTKQRPLVSGKVTLKQALMLLFLNLCGGLYVLTNLPPPALMASAAFVSLSAIYPLAKRYTNYPQFILGMCFNSGVIIGALTSNPDLFNPAILFIYASGIAWTMIYDTVYAYQDIKDDLRIGVKSTAVTWMNKNPKNIMENFVYAIIFCHIQLVFVSPSYIYTLPLLLFSDLYLIKELRKLNLSNREECSQFFKKNNRFGALIFGSLFLASFFRQQKHFLQKDAKK